MNKSEEKRFSTPPNSSAGQQRRQERINTQLDQSPVAGDDFISSDEEERDNNQFLER